MSTSTPLPPESTPTPPSSPSPDPISQPEAITQRGISNMPKEVTHLLFSMINDPEERQGVAAMDHSLSVIERNQGLIADKAIALEMKSFIDQLASQLAASPTSASKTAALAELRRLSTEADQFTHPTPTHIITLKRELEGLKQNLAKALSQLSSVEKTDLHLDTIAKPAFLTHVVKLVELYDNMRNPRFYKEQLIAAALEIEELDLAMKLAENLSPEDFVPCFSLIFTYLADHGKIEQALVLIEGLSGFSQKEAYEILDYVISYLVSNHPEQIEELFTKVTQFDLDKNFVYEKAVEKLLRDRPDLNVLDIINRIPDPLYKQKAIEKCVFSMFMNTPKALAFFDSTVGILTPTQREAVAIKMSLSTYPFSGAFKNRLNPTQSAAVNSFQVLQRLGHDNQRILMNVTNPDVKNVAIDLLIKGSILNDDNLEALKLIAMLPAGPLKQHWERVLANPEIRTL